MNVSRSLIVVLLVAPLAPMAALDGAANVRSDAIRVARFKGDRAAAVSITLDDNLRNQEDVAVPLLNSYGIRATFFVIPGLTPETNEEAAKKSPGEWGGISWPQLRELSAQGHEIASHTWTHEPVITTTNGKRVDMEPAKLDAQLAKACAAITEKIGVAPFTFASPGNAIDDVVRAAVRKYHPVLRDHCERFGDWPPTSKRFSTEQANAMVDRYLAQGKALVWMVHALTDGYNAQSGPEVFGNHLKYLKSREDVLWLDTLAHVSRYTLERDATTLTQSLSGNRAAFTLASPLAPNLFSDPLTVVIPVKAAAQVEARREGSPVLLPVETRNDCILVQAAPSPAQVVVTWRTGAR